MAHCTPRLKSLAALLIMGGCAHHPQQTVRKLVPKQINVVFAASPWLVHFAPGATALDPRESLALAGFVAQIKNHGPPDNLAYAFPGSSDNDALTPLRQASIGAALQSMGLTSQLQIAPIGPAPLTRPNGMIPANVQTVEIGRSTAIVPGCPDWSKPEAAGENNTEPSNFGCSTMADLAAMVANPVDLLHGAPAGNADADFAAHGIELYRAGTLFKASDASSSTSNSSGGSNSSSGG